MSMTIDRLEILVGKCLDGQATPIEQRLLEREMNQNPDAKELFEQWQTLSQWSREGLVDGIVGRGARPEDLFERAWQRHKGSSWRRILRAESHARFPVGLAAGFLLGLILHFTLVWTHGTTDSVESRRGAVVAKMDTQNDEGERVARPAAVMPPSVSRNVDWYGFTDNAGNQWLVQGVEEGKVRPAAYYGL